MQRAANDVMQSIVFSAVLDAVAALKSASGGLPNQLLRDVQLEAIASLPEFWTHTGDSITIMRPEVRALDLGGSFDAVHSVRFAWLKG